MTVKLKNKIDCLLADEVKLLNCSSNSHSYPQVAMGYPNVYQLGMSNLGFQSIYSCLVQAGIACERFFLPEKKDLEVYKKKSIPFFSWESKLPLKNFPVVAFSLSFELDYLNMLRILNLAGISFYSRERLENQPLIVAGGPCAFFNPEPLAEIVDVFFIGEGEEITSDFLRQYLKAYEAGMKKNDILKQLVSLPGVYIPAFYKVSYDSQGMIKERERLFAEAPDYIERQWVKELDKYAAESVILTPHTQFGDMYLTEISRGCGRHCRFCMAGFSYRPPRFRSLDKVWQSVSKGLSLKNKIGLVGAAISDYPEIDSLCAKIAARGGEISVSSLRVDSLTEALLQAVVRSGSRSITIAPEAGSERLRRVINKGITAEDIYKMLPFFNKYQIPQIKLYFMIGLPTEEEQDLEEMIMLAVKLRDGLTYKGRKKIILGVTPFVPKPFTPFQWSAMEPVKELDKKIKYLQKRVQQEPGLALNYESPRMAALQGILARGDRRLSSVLVENYDSTSLSVYKRALKDIGLSLDFYLYRKRDELEKFPWDFLLTGVKCSYLWQEMQKSLKEEYTAICQPEKCRRCGVCEGEGNE